MAHQEVTKNWNQNTGAANTFSYSGSFDVFLATEVKVTLDTVALTYTAGTINDSASPREYNVNITSKTIHIGGADLTSGSIRIYPNTNVASAKATYSAGSNVDSSDLNNNQTQVIRALAEIKERGLTSYSNIVGSTGLTVNTNTPGVGQVTLTLDADLQELSAMQSGAAAKLKLLTSGEVETLDGITSSTTELNVLDGITASTTELNYTDGVTSNIQTQLNAKQAGHANLTDIANLARTDNNIIVGDGSNFILEDPNTARTSLGVAIGSDVQAFHSNLNTLSTMQAGTAGVLAGSTALTATLTEVNTICDGKGVQTTLTNDDTKYPTSGAVVDYVTAQVSGIGGLDIIADEDNFPTSQPVSGVVISISNAGGVVISGSGQATNCRKVGSGSDDVTINNFPSSLYSETLVDGIGLMVSSTGSSDIYNYHKILAKEGDVKQLSDDINDFNARYRVGSSNPSSALDSGDLFFNTATGKMLVYDGTTTAWEDVQAVGNYYINTLSSSSGSPGTGGSASFNGSANRFTLSNAGTYAQQHIVSINGVIQKPNSGTSVPSEGFAIDGSDILLSSAPAASSDYIIVTIGASVNIGAPSNNTVTSAMIVNGTIVNEDISNSAAIEFTKLENLDNAKILVGNGSNKAAKVAVSGDVTIANTGAITIASDAVTYEKMQDIGTANRVLGRASTGTVQEVQVATDMIADDQVTLGKMAGITRGSIIYGDASGAPAYLAKGTNGQVLKSDGTDIAWATDAGLSQEQVEDYVGAMVSGNTETGITVTYEDSDGTLDFVVASQTDNNFTTTLKNKLDGIEASATADQTDAEIRAAVEAATDSNVFTDADHTKLNAIAASANNYTHPNHSGDVTSSGDGATTIANDAVTTVKIADAGAVGTGITTDKIVDANVTQAKIADQAINEAKLQISNSPTNGHVLTAQSGNTGGLTWAAASSGTITALNNQAANRLTTIGATTTELDGEASLTFQDTTSTGLISNKQITGRGFECPAEVSDDWTIAAANNALFPGPMTVASGKTVTIPANRTLTVV